MKSLDITRIRMEEVSLDNPTLRKWYEKAKKRYAAVPIDAPTPNAWVGLYSDDSLLAAYGATRGTDDSAVVTAALCEPSKRGLTALGLLGIMMKRVSERRKIHFVVSTSNKRMRYIASQVLGAKPVAEVMEL